MISTMILLLLLRYRKEHPQQFARLLSKLIYAAKVLLVLLIGCSIALLARTQESAYFYTIKRNGSPVGILSLKETRDNNRIIYRLESEVRTRFLFRFDVRTKEEAVYENGVLLYSFILRKLNGNERANKQTKVAGNGYIIEQKDGKERFTQYPICYNTLCLYTKEPLHTAQVFSDNFQQFLPIQRLGAHHYRIHFPDGNYNDYFYRNALCVRIEVNHSLGKAEIDLDP